MMASSSEVQTLADAKIEAKVLSDMLTKANEASRSAEEELAKLKNRLVRSEALREDAERKLNSEEDRVKELESRLDHDRQIVQDSHKSVKSEKEKLESELEALKNEHEKEVEKLNDQIKVMKTEAREARNRDDHEEMIKAAKEEFEIEAETKLKKALESEKKKTSRAYTMLKEDYDELTTQYKDLQKKMRDRIRNIEQASVESGLKGNKAIDQLKFKEVEVKRYEQEVTTLQVEASGIRAQLDATQAEANATQARLHGELDAKIEAVQTLQVDLAALKVELKTTKKKLRTSKDKRTTLEASLKDHIEKSDATIELLTVDRNALKAELETSQSEVERLSYELKEAQEKVVELFETHQKDTDNIKKIKKDMEASEEALSDAVAQGDLLSKAKVELEAGLADKSSRLTKKSHDLEQALAEIRTVGFQVQAYEMQLCKSSDALVRAAKTSGEAVSALSDPMEEFVAGQTKDEDSDDSDKGDSDEDEEPEGFTLDASIGADQDGLDFAIASLRQQLASTQKQVSRLGAESESAALQAEKSAKLLNDSSSKCESLTLKVRSLEGELASEIASLRRTEANLKAITEREEETSHKFAETSEKLSEVENELAKRNIEFEDCEQKLGDTLARLGTMTVDFEETDSALKATTDVLDNKITELESANAEVEEGQAVLKDLTDRFNEIKSTAASAMSLLGTTRKELSETKTKLESSISRGDKLQEKCADVEKQLVEAESQLQVLSETQADLEESQSFIRSLTKNVDDAATAKAEAEAAKLAAEDEKGKADAVADSKDQLLIACMEKLNRTEADLAATKELFVNAESDINSLQARVQTMTDDAVAAKTMTTSLSKSLEDTKQELQISQRNLEKAEDRVKLLDQKLLVETECGVKLTSLLAKAENTINDCKMEIEKLTIRSSAAESEAQRLSGDVTDLAEMRVQSKNDKEISEKSRLELSTVILENEQLAEKLATVTSLKDEFEKKLTAAERLVSAISVEKLKIAAELKAVKSKLVSADGERNTAEAGLSVTSAKLDAIASTPDDLNAMKVRNEELEAKVQVLTSKLDDATRKRVAAEKLVSAISVEKLKLKAKVQKLESNFGDESNEKDYEIKNAHARSELIHAVMTRLGCKTKLSEIKRSHGGESYGINISASAGGRIVVNSVDAGSPALGNIEPGDVVVAANGTFLLDATYDDVVAKILGADTNLVIVVAHINQIANIIN